MQRHRPDEKHHRNDHHEDVLVEGAHGEIGKDRRAEQVRHAAHQAGNDTDDRVQPGLVAIGYADRQRDYAHQSHHGNHAADDHQQGFGICGHNQARGEHSGDRDGGDQAPETACDGHENTTVEDLKHVGDDHRNHEQRNRLKRWQHDGEEWQGDQRQTDPNGSLAEAASEEGQSNQEQGSGGQRLQGWHDVMTPKARWMSEWV